MLSHGSEINLLTLGSVGSDVSAGKAQSSVPWTFAGDRKWSRLSQSPQANENEHSDGNQESQLQCHVKLEPSKNHKLNANATKATANLPQLPDTMRSRQEANGNSWTITEQHHRLVAPKVNVPIC